MNVITRYVREEKKHERAMRRTLNKHTMYSAIKVGDELMYAKGRNQYSGKVTQKTPNAIFLNRECISRFHIIQGEIKPIALNGKHWD